MSFRENENGYILIMTSLCMTLLFGFLGMAIDVGLLFHAKRNMQAAADAGAISGAAELLYGDVTSTAQAAALQNGVTIAASAVNNPPLHGAYAGKANFVEVTASQSEPTVFMGIFGFGKMMVSARAVGTLVPTPNCVYTLQSSPSGGSGISESGGSTNLSIANCNVIDNATGSNAINLSGGSTLSALSIQVVGQVNNSSSYISPAAATGISPAKDPLASETAPTKPASCTAESVSSTTATIGPVSEGIVCYSSLTINASTVTLNPGVYYINGNLTVSGQSKVSGTGVTFYVTNGGAVSVQGGQVALNLSAPTSGAYSGMLFYQDPSDTQTMTFGGGASGTINGIFYAPDAELNLTGGTFSTFNADLVVGWLNASGGSNLSLYAPIGSTPLSSPALVE